MPFHKVTKKEPYIRHMTERELWLWKQRERTRIYRSNEYQLGNLSEQAWARAKLNTDTQIMRRGYPVEDIKESVTYKFSYGYQEIRQAAYLLFILVFGSYIIDSYNQYEVYFTIKNSISSLFINYSDVDLISKLAKGIYNSFYTFIAYLRTTSFFVNNWVQITLNPAGWFIDVIREFWRSVGGFKLW